MKVWHIDSSSRTEQSQSRRLTKQFVETLSNKTKIETDELDVSSGLPFLNDLMVGSYFTPDEQRSDEQKAVLEPSNRIVKSARESDIWVIGVPVYNFFAPASFKAFIDLLCRAKETFVYGENGPVGLLENKKVFVVITSGGTQIGSDGDFLTPWLIHCLNFIGVSDVQFIKADQYNPAKDDVITKQIEDMTSELSH